MQKGWILLLFILFPLVSFSTLFVLRKPHAVNKKPEVLAAYARNKIITTPTLFIISPTASPSPTTHPATKQSFITGSIPKPQTTTTPADFILEEINIYRQGFNLSRISSNSETCNLARIRAEEISSSFTHDGFNKRVSDKNLPYPSYSEVTENIAYNTDYTDVVKRWIASPGHEENLRKNTPYVCIGKFGDYYVFEGWRP